MGTKLNKIQKSLRQNAIFSGVSGIILILLNKQIANIFELENITVFWSIGVILLFFSFTIIYEIIKQRPIAILWIILQDFLWVIVSIVLIVLNIFDISKLGNLIILSIAIVVLLLGINQSKALAQIDASNNERNKQLKFERKIKADKKSVWNIISDVANYDKVAPNIDGINIISGEGTGMVRICSHGKNNWSETCSLWIEEKAYSFEVNTLESDYPFPFKILKGTWEVEEIDINNTRILMHFDFQYKYTYQNWLLHPLLKDKFSKTAEELLDNWQNILE